MPKYHISKETGRPNICRADKRSCPLGVDTPHFDNKQDARAHAEKMLSEEYGTVKTKKKSNQEENIFSPTNINVNEIEYVTSFSMNDYRDDERDRMLEVIDQTHDWSDNGKGISICSICGHYLSNINIFKHKTGHICVGDDCAESVSISLESGLSLAEAREEEKQKRNSIIAQQYNQQVLDDNPGLEDFMMKNLHVGFIHSVYTQSLGKKLSDPQVVALLRMQQDFEAKEKLEKENEERFKDTPRMPVPDGKQRVAGRVITTKWKNSGYGSQLKMIVEDTRGFRVWVSHPSKVYPDGYDYSKWPEALPRKTELTAGDNVSFTASLTRSPQDEFFGFGKRPKDVETASIPTKEQSDAEAGKYLVKTDRILSDFEKDYDAAKDYKARRQCMEDYCDKLNIDAKTYFEKDVDPEESKKKFLSEIKEQRVNIFNHLFGRFGTKFTSTKNNEIIME